MVLTSFLLFYLETTTNNTVPDVFEGKKKLDDATGKTGLVNRDESLAGLTTRNSSDKSNFLQHSSEMKCGLEELE